MNDQPSFQKLVTQVLSGAPRPLTVDEIQARVEMIRPVDTRNPHNTLRGAIQNLAPAVTLGGRPAHYTWWPSHLVDNTFRQSLALLDLEAGTLALSEEVWLALWPDETLGPWRESTVVTLVLEDGPETSTRVAHFMTDTVSWGLEITPDLAQWHDRSGATLADEWIVRVLGPYMHALYGRGLCLWRLGRVGDARRIFARMLELNPNDNQGVRLLLRDIDEELNWEQSTKRDNKRFP